ncbi:MAG: amidophosphoribosyltransferase [Myxococcales bacterium]|nr:amidophosphoribosyltransferase [Myxococcales bacterium]
MTLIEDDHFHDQCGVFGVYGSPEAANLTYLGLHALQHRGQESAGIATTRNGHLSMHRALGLVRDVFTEEILARLSGDRAIGHVRYSTAGETHVKNAQPLAVDYALGSIAVAHNGNFTNYEELREQLESRGSIFQSTNDSEALVHLIAHSQEATPVDRVADALRQVRGAFTLLFLTPNELIAVRDPNGFRPLSIGRSKNAYVFASEPPAFELIAAEYMRDIEPGEMVVVSESGLRSYFPFAKAERRMCIFEYVYFSRPDSTLSGINVYEARKRLGARLADEAPVDADVVIAVPDSGVAAALGYAQRSGIPLEVGLIRSHYVGRTFIEPESSIRHFGVRLKLSPVHEVLRGKRVIVVDDSIVRGTTSRKIVKMLRDAGAKEVHMRISAPPTKFPCYYGIDTPSRSELIASSHTGEEIAKYITSDSIAYLSCEGMHQAVGGTGYCDACFTGEYPVPFSRNRDTGRRQLALIGV